MRWIGQHIVDFIARFRSDVYLDGIATSTETDMLVINSANKVSKRAIDAITVDVSDFMTNGVDNRVITATGTDAMNAEAQLTWDDTTFYLGDASSDSKLIARLRNDDDAGGILGVMAGGGGGTNKVGGHLALYAGQGTGNAVGGSVKFYSSAVGSSGTTLRSHAEIGSISNVGNLTVAGTITSTGLPSKGAAGNILVDDSGVVSKRTRAELVADLSGQAGADFAMNSHKITGVTDPTSAQDAATKAYVDVTRTLAQGGTGQTSAADAFGALKQAASASATGVVELATTAEADTGTDTTRAITAAGLKSHVDARFSYQYIPLSMNITGSGAGNWEHVSGNGIGNHLYNQDGGSDGTTASNTDGSASTISIHQYQVSGGIIVPYDCVLVGFYGHTRSNNNSARALGLFTGTQNWNTLTPVTAYLRATAQNDTSAVGGDDNYSIRPFEHSVLDVNLSMDAGQCIWMCGRDPAGAGGGMIASVTIVLKTLMP